MFWEKALYENIMADLDASGSKDPDVKRGIVKARLGPMISDMLQFKIDRQKIHEFAAGFIKSYKLTMEQAQELIDLLGPEEENNRQDTLDS